MRSFIAIHLSDEVRKEILKLQDDLKKKYMGVKWVEPQNIHLTLKFLGEIDNVEKVSVCIKRAVKGETTFEINCKDVGAFPDIRRVRVIWVGVGLGRDRVINLMKKLENELAKIGIPKEEGEKIPHITLGRVKKGRVSLPELKFETQPFKVKEIYLMKSTLTSSGPIYSVIEKYVLK